MIPAAATPPNATPCCGTTATPSPRWPACRRGDGFRILKKAAGGLEHGGGKPLPADSPGFRILEEFVRRANGSPGAPAVPAAETAADANRPPFFAGVTMLEDRRLLRRVTLGLAGRLPTPRRIGRPSQNAVATRCPNCSTP